MAPEQHRGETSGPAADQYAFFVALYEALVGHRPFSEAETGMPTLAAAKAKGLPGPAMQALPRRLQSIVERGLRPAPHQRHANLSTVVDRLAPPRRRGLGMAVAALGLLGSTVWVASSAPPACEAAADRELSAAWPVLRWTTTSGETTSVSSRTMAHAHDRVEDWRRRWLALRSEACREARSERISQPVASARRACLRQQLGVSAAALMTVRHAEPDARAQAVAPLSNLPEPEQCRFVDDRAAETNEVPESTLRALETELAEAQAAVAVGDHARGLELATAVQDQARSLRATHLRLTASVAAADALGELDRASEASDRLLQIVEEARVAGMPRLASQAASNLLWVQGVRLRDVAAAEISARLAHTLADQARETVSLHATALANLAVVKEVDGQLQEALNLVLRGTALVQQAPSETLPLRRLRAGLASRRVVLATRLGHFEQAAGAMDEALARAREHYGDLAVQTLGLLGAMAEIDRMMGRAPQALQIHAQLDAAYTVRDGPRSGWVSQNLMNESRLHLDRGDATRALERLDRACAIANEAKGPDSVQASLCAMMQLDARGHDRPPTPATCEQLDRLRAKVVTRLPPGSPFGCEAELIRARCWGNAGRPESALGWLGQLKAAGTIWPEDIALAIADAHQASGDLEAARTHYQRAQQLLAQRRPSLRAAVDAKLVALGQGG